MNFLLTCEDWLTATLLSVSTPSGLWAAIRYATTRWAALTSYCDNGAIEIDNKAAEQSLRAIAIGRRTWMFAAQMPAASVLRRFTV